MMSNMSGTWWQKLGSASFAKSTQRLFGPIAALKVDRSELIYKIRAGAVSARGSTDGGVLIISDA